MAASEMKLVINPLALSWRRPLPYRKQFNGFRHERVKRKFYKMVKATQTIRVQIPDELSECVWPFCEIGT